MVKNRAALGSKHGTFDSFGHDKFSFRQLWTVSIRNIIQAKCIAKFFGNRPTKHKTHSENTGSLVVFTSNKHFHLKSTHHEMNVWTSYLFKHDYLVFKNQGFHVW